MNNAPTSANSSDDLRQIKNLGRLSSEATDAKTRTPMERSEIITATLTAASEDIRFRISRAVRKLLGEAKSSTIDPFEYKNSAQAIGPLAEALRSAASLLDNLHEVATSQVWLSKDVGYIVADIADMLNAACDIEALGIVHPKAISETAQRFDRAAQLVEKSKEVVELAHELQDVELGVNNLGISKEEYSRLCGDPDKRQEIPNLQTKVKAWQREDEEIRPTSRREGPVCEACGLDDPPRGQDIPAVVEKRANEQVLCISCWQEKRSES